MAPLTFAHEWLGKRITASGGDGGLCVDLANQWIAECCGLMHVFANAVDWAARPLPGLRWTPNMPLNAPLPGALVVWGEDAGGGTGPFGHIAMVLAADNLHLLTLDQHWLQGEIVAVNLHSYAGVLGWQTPFSYCASFLVGTSDKAAYVNLIDMTA